MATTMTRWPPSVRGLVPAGVNLQILRRGDRKGFKAGNLAFGLSHSDAPFVAMFDADFVPPPDFLRRTVPVLLADSGLAFVQARWGHANRDANWLTRVQGLLLDSPFRGGTGSALPRRPAACPSTAAPGCGTAPPSNRAAAGPATR